MFERFLNVLRDGFVRQLSEAFPGMEADETTLYVEAWLGIVDSLFVELFYVGAENMERRRVALWHLLGDSLEMRRRSTESNIQAAREPRSSHA